MFETSFVQPKPAEHILTHIDKHIHIPWGKQAEPLVFVLLRQTNCSRYKYAPEAVNSTNTKPNTKHMQHKHRITSKSTAKQDQHQQRHNDHHNSNDTTDDDR